jgi:hypothetical protein
MRFRKNSRPSSKWLSFEVLNRASAVAEISGFELESEKSIAWVAVVNEQGQAGQRARQLR